MEEERVLLKKSQSRSPHVEYRHTDNNLLQPTEVFAKPATRWWRNTETSWINFSFVKKKESKKGKKDVLIIALILSASLGPVLRSHSNTMSATAVFK